MRVFFAVLLLFVSGSTVFAQDSKENGEFKLAVGLYNDRMYDLALEQLKNFIAAYPATSQGIEARYYLGLSQMKVKHYDDARITFQNFALTYTEHPKAPEAWMEVGDAFAAAGNEHEAALAYERVKAFYPKSSLVPDALLKAGTYYRRIGDHESAKMALRTVVQDYPSSKSVLAARLALGEVYAEENQSDLAENEAKHVAETDAPPSVKASALLFLGKLKAATSLFNEAETILARVTTTFKTTPAALEAAFVLGTSEMNDARYTAALEHFKLVASSDTSSDSLQEKSLFNIGRVNQLEHKYSEAQTSFQKLWTIFPKSPLIEQAILEAGKSALANDNPADALGKFKKILSQEHSTLERPALRLAARAAAAMKHYNEAAIYYTTFDERYPDESNSADILLSLGKLYQNDLEDFRKAIATYDQLVGKYSSSAAAVEALAGTAECFEHLGDEEGALRTYRGLQERFPAHELYEEIEQKIQALELFKIKHRNAGIDKLARLIGNVVTQQSKAEIAYQLGEIYFHDFKDYNAAAEQFSTAIDNGLDKEKFINAYYLRARSYHIQSLIDSSLREQAILYYAAFLKQYPAGTRSDDAAYFLYTLKSRGRTTSERMTLAQEFLAAHSTSVHNDEIEFEIGTLAENREAIGALNTIIAQRESHLYTQALFRRGLTYLTLRQPDSAASSWRAAAEHSPADLSTLRSLWNLADLEWQRNNIQEAIALWNKIVDEFPYTSFSAKSLERLPAAYLANGQYDEAISTYKLRLQHHELSETDERDDGSVLYDLGNAYDRKGEGRQAADYYHRYLARHRKGPLAAKAFYALGALTKAEGKNDLASSYFTQAGSLDISSVVTKDIADLLFQTEQYSQAAKQYRRLAQEGDSIDQRKYCQSRAIVSMLRAGDLAESQKLVSEYTKMFPKDKPAEAEFVYEKASYYYRKQDYASAKKLFETVTDDYEDTRFGPYGRYYLGKMLEISNKLADAAKTYEGILKKFPSSDVLPRVLLSLGNMHFNAERFEDAIRYYQRITAEPEKAGDILPYAMNNLIEAYESTKLYDDAIRMTRNFNERFPNDESILDKKIKLGTLLTRVGYYDQAIQHFENLLSEAGSSLEAEVRYDIGEAFYYKGDYPQAILEFLKVPYLVSKQGKVNWAATSFYMAGQSYEKMSKFDEAINMYQQIIERPGADATFKSGARKEIDRVKALMKKESK